VAAVVKMVKPQSEHDELAPLPRGRHGLTPEEVGLHQRERIVAAIAAAIADHGYGGYTVERVIDIAGVSGSTFYVHFANKEEAVLAAHTLIFERFMVELTDACADQSEWPMKVRSAIGATVEFATTRPRQSQILSIGSLTSNAALAERITSAYDRLAKLLGGVRLDASAASKLPSGTEQFLVAAVAAIVAGCLARGEFEQLRSLQAELVELTLIPYYGAAEAARLARLPR
jgi:AcrR family transcriptional regulator